jgi:hypothetical protein
MLRALLAVLLFAAAPAFAQAPAKDLSLAAFFGVFRGGGVAEATDDPAFRTAMRDSQVEIRAAEGNGFRIAWSTTAPRGNPNQPTPKTKTTEMTFKAGAKPGMFEAVPQGNPLAGQDLAWARLKRQTLTIYSMTTTPEGSYEMQKWDRTLQGTGMLLTYSRVSDGEATRTVKARLTKEGK